MGFLDFIKGKKGGRKEPADQLALLGADESRSGEFVELLSQSKIWVLGVPKETRTDAAEIPSEIQVFQEVKQHMSAAAQAKSTDDLEIHTFKLEDYTVVPFFTSQEFLVKYAENVRTDKVTYISGYQSDPVILLRADLLRLPAIMNPNSSSTRLFKAEDKVALAKLLSARQR